MLLRQSCAFMEAQIRVFQSYPLKSFPVHYGAGINNTRHSSVSLRVRAGSHIIMSPVCRRRIQCFFFIGARVGRGRSSTQVTIRSARAPNSIYLGEDPSTPGTLGATLARRSFSFLRCSSLSSDLMTYKIQSVVSLGSLRR